MAWPCVECSSPRRRSTFFNVPPPRFASMRFPRRARAESGLAGAGPWFNRPNLRFAVKNTPSADAKRTVLQRQLLALPPNGAAIVYVGRRREAIELAAFITEAGRRRAIPYHAGLRSEDRSRLQTEFMSGQHVLDYFGNPEPPHAARCCDNCERRPRSARSQRRAPAGTAYRRAASAPSAIGPRAKGPSE